MGCAGSAARRQGRRSDVPASSPAEIQRPDSATRRPSRLTGRGSRSSGGSPEGRASDSPHPIYRGSGSAGDASGEQESRSSSRSSSSGRPSFNSRPSPPGSVGRRSAESQNSPSARVKSSHQAQMEIFRQEVMFELSAREQRRSRGEEVDSYDDETLGQIAQIVGGRSARDGKTDLDPRVAQLFSLDERAKMVRLGITIEIHPFLEGEAVATVSLALRAAGRDTRRADARRSSLPDDTLRALAESGDGRPTTEPASYPWSPGASGQGRPRDPPQTQARKVLAQLRPGTVSPGPSRSPSSQALRRDGSTPSMQHVLSRLSWEYRSTDVDTDVDESPRSLRAALGGLNVGNRTPSRSRMGSRLASFGSFGRLDEHSPLHPEDNARPSRPS